MKHLPFFVLLFVFTTSSHAQHLDVEGDARIEGKLNIIKSIGDSSIFIGANAGAMDDGLNFNVFVGPNAGKMNTSGSFNSFFGSQAGEANTSASANSFFGYHAGKSNTIGRVNSFFGQRAGESNTSGLANSFFGNQAGASNTIGQANSFFGQRAGEANTSGGTNSFFGYEAGESNITGQNNSFFGSQAGEANTTGGNNSFFGFQAGNSNSIGQVNSFFGFQAGKSNTSAGANSFFGFQAGESNTTGGNNSFFGNQAGLSNTTGGNNSFFGYRAGQANTTGFENIFLGHGSGQNVQTSSRSVSIGANSGQLTSTLLDRTFALGHEARVNCSNCGVLGGTDENALNIGIGTTTPTEKLHIDNAAGAAGIRVNAADGAASFIRLVEGNELGYELEYNGADDKLHLLEFGLIDPPPSKSILMTWNKFGKVGIGDPNPQADLHIKQSSEDASGGIRLFKSTDGNNWTTSISTANWYSFYRNGSISSAINLQGDYVNIMPFFGQNEGESKSSDISSIASVLNKVMQLKPSVRRSRNKKNNDKWGFDVNHLSKLFPEITPEVNGQKGVIYDYFGILAIKALQELASEIALKDEAYEVLQSENELQNLRIESQLKQINNQQMQIDELKQMVSNLVSKIDQINEASNE